MTVAELIEKLQDMDEDLEVRVNLFGKTEVDVANVTLDTTDGEDQIIIEMED